MDTQRTVAAYSDLPMNMSDVNAGNRFLYFMAKPSQYIDNLTRHHEIMNAVYAIPPCFSPHPPPLKFMNTYLCLLYDN
jgi:hypothetical protein